MKICTLLMIILCALPASTFAAGGHSEGNGGDGYTQEFKAIALRVASYLKSGRAKLDTPIDVKKFCAAIKTVNLSSTDKVLYLDGVPKDLINYPRENKIIISRPRWRSLIESQKYSIVTHELLDIIGANDRKYEISWQIVLQSHLIIDTTKTAQGKIDPRAYQNAIQMLQGSLTNGYQASTSAQEKAILLEGIRSVLDSAPENVKANFVATLEAALSDIQSYNGNNERQVYLLRTYTQFTIEDLTELQSNPSVSEGYSYLTQLLQRGLTLGFQANTNVEELNLLTRAAQRGLQVIEDNRSYRTPEGACLHKDLTDALAISADDTLAIKMQVLLMRQTLSQISSMNNLNCS